MVTCMKCEWKFSEYQMDTDERMCYECIDEISEKYSKENDNE